MKTDPILNIFNSILKAYPHLIDDFVLMVENYRNSKECAERFTDIYINQKWGGKGTVSGNGSTMSYTEAIRAALPEVFIKFDIHSVFDGPCGDFNWMSHVVNNNHMITKYIGGDIVEDMINQLNEKYASDRVEFLKCDIIQDGFPDVDLMICRDCLFHLPNSEIIKFFKNFIKSDIKYLLTTTHYPTLKNVKFNENIPFGNYRLIDLFAPPFSLPEKVLFRFDDSHTSEERSRREMVLWSREQLKLRIGYE